MTLLIPKFFIKDFVNASSLYQSDLLKQVKILNNFLTIDRRLTGLRAHPYYPLFFNP